MGKTKSQFFSKQIDKQSVKSFLEKAVSAGRLTGGRYSAQMVLKKFGLVDEDYLTNAGNVLFGSSHPVTLKAALLATDEKLAFWICRCMRIIF